MTKGKNMDDLTKSLLKKGYVSVDQLILVYAHKKKQPLTIGELSKELEMPRTTIMDHLGKLEADGFVTIKREGRERKIFPAPDISGIVTTAVDNIRMAYLKATRYIAKSKAEELKSLEKRQ